MLEYEVCPFTGNPDCGTCNARLLGCPITSLANIADELHTIAEWLTQHTDKNDHPNQGGTP